MHFIAVSTQNVTNVFALNGAAGKFVFVLIVSLSKVDVSQIRVHYRRRILSGQQRLVTMNNFIILVSTPDSCEP